MTWDALFGLSNSLALAGWAILFLAPRRDWLLALAGVGLPLLLAAAYTLLVLGHFAAARGDFNSIAGVRALFASDPVLVAGWQHYLAYDLFLGAWVARRLDAAGIARVLQWPVLATCFMFGPAGFLLGLALEGGWRGARALRARAPLAEGLA
ncbi:abscisic acid-deficient protein Aba4 family protein [Oceanicella sp. SM1341]|uniref:abscisic acid-deficient protein Aba4 family protein n=1 Tax=Oceanicella sp. SM1341 TaxID=1548889 RepID=UPI000E4CFE0B|nr:abscisic acid-deficient protein Aba4 family protein [Oceanicella sp. SM1341]